MKKPSPKNSIPLQDPRLKVRSPENCVRFDYLDDLADDLGRHVPCFEGFYEVGLTLRIIVCKHQLLGTPPNRAAFLNEVNPVDFDERRWEALALPV